MNGAVLREYAGVVFWWSTHEGAHVLDKRHEPEAANSVECFGISVQDGVHVVCWGGFGDLNDAVVYVEP